MKTCPACSFSNDERFPTCAMCNALLIDVKSIPSADPNHPEHQRKATNDQRNAILHRQMLSASVLYSLVITLTALAAGGVYVPQVLALYLVSAIVVAATVVRSNVGHFSASFLQGFLSLCLLLCFGPLQPFIFFMLALHIMIPALFWHWIDMLYDMRR